ncbi:alpha/beta hydrolase [Aquabacterium sp.]|uniref:alpha/beta hydrolase n=1 Tax=Aquabacterium sp. TaxID=1872578 RepID=UPI002C689F9A|nr:alpha/beta hydrolase [Aquabacterium sp.]HSW09140.1 alpha/beta hydrolase [Aquabacterium sp.]
MLAQKDDAPAARRRQMYERGATPAFACRADPRFSYCLYVPPSFDDDPAGHALVVAMHGSGRTMEAYRDRFASFGRYRRCVILAPLFPVGPLGDGNAHGFKVMEEGGVRYDKVLLAMVDEAGARLGARFGRFLLFGYSGGGHFAHRFFYLHPERLQAVAIGAPGSVTLLDDRRDWPVGTRDLKARFGREIDLEAMRAVRVQLVVGAADIETWEINYPEDSVQYAPGINDTGRTRPERIATLAANLAQHGIACRHDIVPNVAHEGAQVLPQVCDFFEQVLADSDRASA